MVFLCVHGYQAFCSRPLASQERIRENAKISFLIAAHPKYLREIKCLAQDHFNCEIFSRFFECFFIVWVIIDYKYFLRQKKARESAWHWGCISFYFGGLTLTNHVSTKSWIRFDCAHVSKFTLRGCILTFSLQSKQIIFSVIFVHQHLSRKHTVY